MADLDGQHDRNVASLNRSHVVIHGMVKVCQFLPDLPRKGSNG